MTRLTRSTFLFVFLLAACPQRASSQLFYSGTEYGISIGGSHYFGDLNDKYGLQSAHPVGGVFIRQLLTPYIAIRGSLSYTQVGYKDAFNANAFYKARNLSFQNDIVELSVQSEFNFTRFSTGEDGKRFTPYLTGGIGAFYFNPYTEFAGRKQYLRKLGTEGQNLDGYENRKYSTVAVCFPVGLGFKYWLKPGLNLGFEIADRLTLTDYIDDVSTSYVGSDNFPTNPDFPSPAYSLQDRSANQFLGGQKAGKQRGNSQTRDQYLYAIFNLSFQLKVYRCPNYIQADEYEQ